VKERGFTITQEPATVTEKVKVAFFLGPDDYSFELVQVKD